jgi:hypothetical protein
MKKWNLLLIMCLTFGLAFSARAQVNNAELKGDYAFTFDGMTTGGGGAFTAFAAVGRFTADGAGNLINGELDVNGAGPNERLIAQAFNGTYAIGADHRGVMNLNVPGGGTLAFAMLANGNAKFIEIDASGTGTVGSGSIERSDPGTFSTSRITGDYAFGVAGWDGWNNRSAITGRMTANGAGTFTNGLADINQAGRYTSASQFVTANYMVTDNSTGRGIMVLPPLPGAVQTLNFAFYMVNAEKIFTMESDAVTVVTPLLNGSVLRQQIPLGGFSSASLNGGSVLYLTGRTICPGTATSAPDVIGGLLTTNGLGAASLTYDQNCGGAATSITGLAGTYNVLTGGRADFRLGSAYIAAYLVGPNKAFFIVPDGACLFGMAEAQAGGALTAAAVNGAYAGSTTSPQTVAVTIFSGEFTADGVGTISGTEDIGAPGGASSTNVSTSYSVSSAPTNGRGSISGTIGGNGVVYVISPSKFVVISMSDANPAVLAFEQ